MITVRLRAGRLRADWLERHRNSQFVRLGSDLISVGGNEGGFYDVISKCWDSNK